MACRTPQFEHLLAVSYRRIVGSGVLGQGRRQQHDDKDFLQ
jgi:hypothetical protein